VRHLCAPVTYSIPTSPGDHLGLLTGAYWLPLALGSKQKLIEPLEIVAPTLWNALPLDLRSEVSVDTFKKQLKTHLFRLAFV